MSSLFAQMAEAHASLLTAAAAAAAEEDAGAARLLELSTAARDLDHALATWRGQAPEASRAALCVADALRQLSEATRRRGGVLPTSRDRDGKENGSDTRHGNGSSYCQA